MSSFTYRSFQTDLEHHGALIPVTLTAPVEMVAFLRESGFPPFASRSGYALIDTGARRSGVDEQTMAELQIPPVGEELFLTAHGVADLPVFNLSAVFPDFGAATLPLVAAPGGLVRDELVQGQHISMLLGRDLLQRFVFTYDGPNATVTLQG